MEARSHGELGCVVGCKPKRKELNVRKRKQKREKNRTSKKLFICFEAEAETNIYFYTSSAMENTMITWFYIQAYTG